MITKRPVTLSIDEKILNEGKKTLKELGFKLSTYVEMVLKSLVDSKTKTAQQVYEELFEGLGKELIKSGKGSKKPARKVTQRQQQ